MKVLLFTVVTILSVSCHSQVKKTETGKIGNSTEPEITAQIGQYVVAILQDSKGNIWFGTLAKGVAKYDGKKLVYLTSADGLPSNRVVNIIEDNSGNIWFATGAGISNYNGKIFTNYSEKDGLCSDMISSLLIDSKGVLWIGTWGGVCKFDGMQFQNFPIPYPKIETRINPDTKNWITEIIEDDKGNIWFARDGYGAAKYDRTNFTHHLKKNGLYSNNVMEIEVDSHGNIWFGSRVGEKDNPDPKKRKGKGGVTKFDGKSYIHFPNILGLNEADVFEIYKDSSDNIWISTTNFGVYKYDGTEFKNYEVPIAIMTMTEDDRGNMWLGGAGGLYRINMNGEMVSITTIGPWH